MKLNAKQIDGFLARPAQAGGVLLYGPDRGLIHQRFDKVAGAIIKDLADPFNRVDLREEQLTQEPSLLADELAAISFTGERRLVTLREAGDSATQAIKDALARLDKQNYLIVTAGELTPRSKLRLLFEQEAALAALPCYADDGHHLQQLIRQTLSDYGLRIDAGALQYLSMHLGGDRMVILSELEKIALYFEGKTQLEMASLRQLVESSNEKTLDDAALALAGRDAATFCPLLDRLLLTGQSSVAILRSLYRVVERLEAIQAGLAQGKSADQAIQAIRPPIFFKQQAQYRGFLRYWNARQVADAKCRLTELELLAKSGQYSAELAVRQGLLLLISHNG